MNTVILSEAFVDSLQRENGGFRQGGAELDQSQQLWSRSQSSDCHPWLKPVGPAGSATIACVYGAKARRPQMGEYPAIIGAKRASRRVHGAAAYILELFSAGRKFLRQLAIRERAPGLVAVAMAPYVHAARLQFADLGTAEKVRLVEPAAADEESGRLLQAQQHRKDDLEIRSVSVIDSELDVRGALRHLERAL